MVRRIVLVPSYGATANDVWINGAYYTRVYLLCGEHLRGVPGDQLLELALVDDPSVRIMSDDEIALLRELIGGEIDEQAKKVESTPT